MSFGNQEINLHELGNEFEPKACNVQFSSADLCFVVKTPLEQAMTHLVEKGVPITEGPVSRTEATEKINSAYFRDPDGNLIEVSNYTNM